MNTGEAAPELMIVVPVYNEQACLRKVVLEWFSEIEDWTENFRFLVINDGSTDRTPTVLERLKGVLGARFEVISRENRGHGQSCIEGYALACESGSRYILQIDSDGQCDPQYFFRFWRDKEKYDVIYGKRTRRDDGWRRVIASLVLKWTLRIFAQSNCLDANVPYRLMKSERIRPFLNRIPKTFFLSNVALAILLRKDRGISHAYVPIGFRCRYGGEPSVAISRFGAKAFELIRQIRDLKNCPEVAP